MPKYQYLFRNSEDSAYDLANYLRYEKDYDRITVYPSGDEWVVRFYKSKKVLVGEARAKRIRKAGRGLGRLPANKPYTATKPKRKPAHAKKYRTQLERIFSGFGKVY